MRLQESICLLVQSRLPMRRPSDFLAMVKCQVENLPEYMPMKWGSWGPLKNFFYPQLLHHLMPLNCSHAETVNWKRTGKDRANGTWSIRTDFPANSDLKPCHADINLNTYTTKHQKALLHFFKTIGVSVQSSFGYCDAETVRYLPIAAENNWGTSWRIFITTHVLRHWLPDMPWASLWGLDYIELFGKERLLGTPAYKTELLADDVIFVQLTPDLNDLWENFGEVMAAREKAKRHLGYDCFWQKKMAYDWKDNPEKAGKVFQVPDFKFIEDGFPTYDGLTITQAEIRLEKKVIKQGGVTPAILAEVEKLVASGSTEVNSDTPAKLEKLLIWHIESQKGKISRAAIKGHRAEEIKALLEAKETQPIETIEKALKALEIEKALGAEVLAKALAENNYTWNR